MTLADEDTISVLTDNANRAIQGNVAMQVTQSGLTGIPPKSFICTKANLG